MNFPSRHDPSAGARGDKLPFHRLDPRSKIAAAASLSVVFMKGGPLLLCLASLGITAIIIAGRLSKRRLYAAAKPALPFIAAIFLLHLFFSTGRPLFNLPAVPMKVITVEGLMEGAFLAWRFTLLLLVGYLLTATTPAPELTSGMERLLRPLCRKRISSQDLALMLSLAMRFVPTLHEELGTLKEAQAARGADLAAPGLVRKVRAVSSLVLPLFLAAFRRCDHLVEAMYARGYDGGPRTTLRGELVLSGKDRVVIGLAFVAGIGSLIL